MPDILARDGRPVYRAAHFDPLFAAEDRHFWFWARTRCIAAATRLIPNHEMVKDVLEHGCGTGFVLAELQRLFPHARVTGTDLFAEGLALARRRFAGPLIQADLLECDGLAPLDLIGLFDVLEHLDDDLQVLRALWDQLRPGGWLLMTVPAHMALWSDYDLAAGHRRRYERLELEARLAAAAFQVEYCTEFMFPLWPLMWLRRRISWRRRAAGVAPTAASIEKELYVHPVINQMLKLILHPEPLWVKRRRSLPCGTSLLALARRNAQ